MTPIETIAEELERAGVKRFDVKSFLLGLGIGRLASLNNEDEIRRVVRIHYPRRRRDRTEAQT